jgi:hypothetical protein
MCLKRWSEDSYVSSMQAVIVRPLSAVEDLVRFAEEPQMFAIDFNDGCPIHVSFADCFYLGTIYGTCQVIYLPLRFETDNPKA